MEIDFLGLNSSKYKLEQANLKNPYLDSARGVETSLSLSTSSSFNFSDKKKWEFASKEDEMRSSSCRGDTICGVDKSHVTEQPSLLLVAPPAFRQASGGPNLRNLSLLAETNGYNNGNASNGISDGGHTPTVAMARRATLARFLEKRLHRMNQARTSHLMGKSLGLTNSEACETTITRNSNKKSNDPKRR
ncbi:uncharacterized protein LOC125223225 isoform X2 [Salvia hispanica]|uniref:uncharacterized protein LOC125223225 isoform X2 n=1 Tax=Salvia hispanica TaxID=49212 RepID=UPI00200965F4|nr:uncharacterized protein LOC125223225 isoform X2 [Salvia hispanica]